MAHRYSIRHWFVPTKHNQFHPHLLRSHSLAVVAGFMVLVQVLFNASLTGQPNVLGFATDINVGTIVNLTNQERSKGGLGNLTTNAELMQAAQAKADDMFANNYWAHVSPSGTTPWSFFQAAGYQYEYAGENLAKDFNSSAGVLNGWMNSPEHRDNILNGNYTNIGVAVKNGQLEGKDTTLVVALYATPAKSALDSVFGSIIPTANADTAGTSTSSSGSWLSSISLATGLNWPELTLALLLIAFIAIYLNDHRVKVKFALPRNHHSHSLLQAAVLLSALVVILVSSRGLIH